MIRQFASELSWPLPCMAAKIKRNWHANQSSAMLIFSVFEIITVVMLIFFSLWNMEDEAVDTIIIESWQHKMGQMVDFLPLFASSDFDL